MLPYAPELKYTGATVVSFTSFTSMRCGVITDPRVESFITMLGTYMVPLLSLASNRKYCVPASTSVTGCLN